MTIKKDLKKKDQKHAWYVRFYLNGEQITKRGFRTKSEAKEYANDMIAKYDKSPNMKFSDFVDLYFEEKSHELKPTTLNFQKSSVYSRLVPYFGDKPLNAISVNDVRAWHNELRAAGLSDTYMNALNAHLKTIFNHAVKFYDLKENPCIKAGSVGKSKAPEMNYWTLEEFKEFISHVDNFEYKVAFEALFITGLRIGELRALTPADIDFEVPSISVTKNLQRVKGKSVLQTPKTASSVRTVTIPHSLATEIKELCDRRFNMKDTDFIFRFSGESYRDKLRKICKEYGLKPIRIHDFRHSCASYLINVLGKDVSLVSRRLGHATASTTLNIYIHFFESRNLELIDELEGII